jgi:hypothetical protein
MFITKSVELTKRVSFYHSWFMLKKTPYFLIPMYSHYDHIHSHSRKILKYLRTVTIPPQTCKHKYINRSIKLNFQKKIRMQRWIKNPNPRKFLSLLNFLVFSQFNLTSKKMSASTLKFTKNSFYKHFIGKQTEDNIWNNT